jgi:hypothetical protein
MLCGNQINYNQWYHQAKWSRYQTETQLRQHKQWTCLSDHCPKQQGPSLTTNSLVSVPKLANAGYITIFHSRNSGVTIHDDIQTCKPAVLQGWRDQTGLCQLDCKDKQTNHTKKKVAAPGRQPSTTDRTDSAANVYTLPSIKHVINFLHAAAGFPTKDSWLEAISKRYYRSWPGITPRTVLRHFPDDTSEIQKGHMKKEHQNVCLMKQSIVNDSMDNTHHLSKQQVLP